MVKKDRIKPFRDQPSSDEVVDISSTLRKDRTPIPDKRFTLPPKYGVTAHSSDTTDEHEYNGHEYVDLGLPSGTLWAKMNVGAESETDGGLYFAWGETEGYADASTKAFSWSDYKWTEDDGDTMSKYNATDGLTHLELTDDAAAANMGGDWHMPNKAQCIELFKETKNGFVTNAGAFTQYAWDDSNGYSSPTQTTATISGWNTGGYFFFKSDVSDMNAAITSGDYLFVPAAGVCGDGGVLDVGGYGYVWASALRSESVKYAWVFYFGSDEAGVYRGSRVYGQSVRGVVGQMDETTPGGGGESGPIK